MARKTPAPIEARPPRPKPIDHDQRAEFARLMGMKAHELVDITDEPGGDGHLVTTFDGIVNLIRGGRYLGRYQPRPGHEQATDERWTLDDLVAEADRLAVPDEQNVEKWVGGDPRRAFAAWRQRAAVFGMSMANVVVRDAMSNEFRRLVLASDWLTDEDAARL